MPRVYRLDAAVSGGFAKLPSCSGIRPRQQEHWQILISAKYEIVSGSSFWEALTLC
jgi:hypothetical protein